MESVVPFHFLQEYPKHNMLHLVFSHWDLVPSEAAMIVKKNKYFKHLYVSYICTYN